MLYLHCLCCFPTNFGCFSFFSVAEPGPCTSLTCSTGVVADWRCKPCKSSQLFYLERLHDARALIEHVHAPLAVVQGLDSCRHATRYPCCRVVVVCVPRVAMLTWLPFGPCAPSFCHRLKQPGSVPRGGIGGPLRQLSARHILWVWMIAASTIRSGQGLGDPYGLRDSLPWG